MRKKKGNLKGGEKKTILQNYVMCIFLMGLCFSVAFCINLNLVYGQDGDGDGVPDITDNCPVNSNPLQEDSYPPLGNGCGNACDCEGNFDGNLTVDGIDAVLFNTDIGRGPGNIPCTPANPCNGDFDCDGDVDLTDQGIFVADSGRSGFSNPCPLFCAGGPWCLYPDADGDGIQDDLDNCPNRPNGPFLGTCTSGPPGTIGIAPCMASADCDPSGFCSTMQEDIYPAGGNGFGDACDCEGNFDGDPDVDGSDAAKFREDFGRNLFKNPCPI